MKKQLLLTALSSLLCFSVHAEDAQTTTPIAAAETTESAPQAAQDNATPAPAIESTLAAAPMALPVIDCNYAIPSTTRNIDKTVISAWAEKAAIQVFDFTPATITEQLDKLKPCFTDQGWQGYYEALIKSGNMESIKTHNLVVTSKIEGEPSINPVKENQWKITLPMSVMYKNDQETFNQQLSVDLLVSRKTSGGLGIMQVIASLRDTVTNPKVVSVSD